MDRMGKEETLQRIKETEAEVRRSRDAAQEQKERILRDARKDAFDLREKLRAEAEALQGAILTAGDATTAREKETILAEGRKEAEALRREAQLNIDRAVERLVEKFKGALNV